MVKKLPDVKNQAGFTLLEVLIAMVILSVGLLALARFQLTVIKGNTDSREITTAVVLAETKIEELMSGGFAALAAGEDTDIDTTGTAGGIFTRAWAVADYSGSTNMKQITVTVTWTDQEGISHNVALNTVLANN